MSADSNNPYAQMTGARQTMIAWARPVDSFEDLPEIYRDPVRELVENTNNIPYSVLAPAQGNPFNGKKFSEKVLFEIGDVLFILEKRDGQVLKTCLPYADVCSLEIGNILLFSWFEIKVRTQTGSIITSTVEYNETTLRYFAPFLQKMRPVTVESATLDMKAERARFDTLASLNFKFMNYARDSLVPSEMVNQFIFQPKNCQNMFSLFGHNYYRTISQAHLVILTDSEVILIGDTVNTSDNKRSKYGGVRRFLPLRSIVSVTLEPTLNNLYSFRMQIAPQLTVARLFDAAHLTEVENIKKAIEVEVIVA